MFAASGAFLLLVGVSTVRESYREWKVDQEIRGLEDQIQRLEGRKLKISELLQRIDAPEAIDREARARLGMRKPGERVIILRGAENGSTSWQETLADESVSPPAPDTRSNPQKWLAYFFQHD
jgi:hypothetical protein